MTPSEKRPSPPDRPSDAGRSASRWCSAFVAAVVLSWFVGDGRRQDESLGRAAALLLAGVPIVYLAAIVAGIVLLRRRGWVLPLRILVGLHLFLGIVRLTGIYASGVPTFETSALFAHAAYVVTGVGACVALVRARFAVVSARTA